MLKVLVSLAIASLVALLITAGITLAGQGEKKGTMCHPTASGKFTTITVAEPAVPAYQAQGDTLGPCPGEYP
jgi:hypothetical protein